MSVIEQFWRDAAGDKVSLREIPMKPIIIISAKSDDIFCEVVIDRTQAREIIEVLTRFVNTGRL